METYEQSNEQSTEQGIEQSTEQGIEQSIEQGNSQSTEQGIELKQPVYAKLSPEVEARINTIYKFACEQRKERPTVGKFIWVGFLRLGLVFITLWAMVSVIDFEGIARNFVGYNPLDSMVGNEIMTMVVLNLLVSIVCIVLLVYLVVTHIVRQ